MAIGPDDRGFTLGDGLFETLAAQHGRLCDVARHLARMATGCAALGLPPPDLERAGRLLREALPADATGQWAVRLTLTAGPGGRGLERPSDPTLTLVATAAPAPRPAGPARLATVGVRRNAGSPASRLKTLSYLDNVLARAEARAAGADEAVMLNTAGHVACAAAANIFWTREGVLFTPALDCGVLAGVTREDLMAAARGQGVEVREAAAGPEALAQADGVLITSSLIGARPVASVDGRALGLPPLIAQLAGALAERQASSER